MFISTKKGLSFGAVHDIVFTQRVRPVLYAYGNARNCTKLLSLWLCSSLFSTNYKNTILKIIACNHRCVISRAVCMIDFNYKKCDYFLPFAIISQRDSDTPQNICQSHDYAIWNLIFCLKVLLAFSSPFQRQFDRSINFAFRLSSLHENKDDVNMTQKCNIVARII